MKAFYHARPSFATLVSPIQTSPLHFLPPLSKHVDKVNDDSARHLYFPFPITGSIGSRDSPDFFVVELPILQFIA